ncbi:MAG TPA: hypothetical protein VL098_11270, partial [Flavipsychrobacter sp.]|nr:hypothetical protein [Flavipsychrobacter sp.]
MKRLLHAFIVLLIAVSGFSSYGQTNLSTGNPSATTLIGTSPTGILFVLENNNPYPITISDIDVFRGSSTNGLVHDLLYNPVTLSGSTNLGTDVNWQLISSVTVGTISANGIAPAFTGLNFTMPANTTYRFAIRVPSSTIVIGGTSNTVNTYSAGGVTLGTGNYQISSMNTGGYISNNSSTAGNYYFGGTVVFAPSSPCISPPTAGTATVTNASPCAGSTVDLNLAGATGGLTQTYQWEESTSPTGPFVPIGSAQSTSSYKLSVPTTAGTYYYRCTVTCGSSSASSTNVIVNVPANYPGGTYTINSALPTGSGNFQTFADAAAAINCGISGPVVFNVAPGVYNNDKFYLDSVANTSNINTITINGNGATLINTSTSANDRATVRFYGTDYVTIDSLRIIAGGTGSSQYGVGVQMISNADNNTIRKCTIAVDCVTASTNFTPIAVSGSLSSATTAGSGCDSNKFINNSISGGYYAITILGTSTAAFSVGNVITGNNMRNFY